MTSHIVDQRSRPKPAIRRNRNPLSSEHSHIREEKALNDSLVARLQQELDMRTTRLRCARENVEMKAAECENARLRLKTATSIRDELVKTRGLNMASYFIKEVDKPISEANIAVRMAQDAVVRSLEEEKVALIREQQCTSILNVIQTNIDEIAAVSQAQNSRAIFRIHDEIWREIFLRVVSNVDHNDPFPAVKISAVSYSWRVAALAFPVLWRNIHMRALGFSSNDLYRIALYRQRSGDRLIRITLQFEEPPSHRSRELLVDSITGIGSVDSMLITGNSGGARTKGAGVSVAWCVLKAIGKLKSLEICYPSEIHGERHKLPVEIIEGLEELVLRNCVPIMFKEPGQAGEQSRLVRLSILRSALALPLRWDLFHNWVIKARATLEDLRLSTTFSQDQFPNIKQPTIFSRLGCIGTCITNILLLFNSSVRTPALRTLVISHLGTVDVHAWKIYATDLRGGGRIIDVDIIGEIGINDVEAYSACLKCLSSLENLALYDKNVDPLLEALTLLGTADGTGRPLAKLSKLTIVDYHGDGMNILLFAIQSQSDFNLEDSSSRGVARTLRVRLRNCRNISSYVSRQLREIGSTN